MIKYNSLKNQCSNLTSSTPAESCSTPPELLPPGNSGGLPSSLQLKKMIVKEISDYSAFTQEKALLEMLHRLEKEFNDG